MSKTCWTLLLVFAAAAGAVAGGCVPCDEEPMAPAPKPAAPPAPCPTPGESSSSLAVPTGVKSTSVLFIEKMAPSEVVAGQKFSYTIKATNLTNLTLMDVKVMETVPGNLKVLSTDPTAAETANQLTWTLDKMAPNSTKVMTVTAQATKGGKLMPCTEVSYRPPALCVAMNACDAALTITKEGPDQVMLCEPITYTVIVKNTGDCAACNVQITDELPDGLTTADGKSVVMSRPVTLKPGESRKMTINAKASKVGSFTNNATATADGDMSVASNKVTTTVVKPTLKITKTGPKMRYVGRPAEYTITVQNSGKVDARDVVVTDTMASGSQFSSASDGGSQSGNTVRWSLGTLKAGQKKSVNVTVTASSIGKICNTATARAYCADEVSAEACTDIEGKAAILLECVDLQDPIEVGANEVYEIIVTNQGSSVGTGIVITATLPAEQDFVSATGPGVDHSAKGKKITFKPLKSLAPGAKATYRVTSVGKKTGDVRFKVELTSDQMTSPAMETESTHIYAD